MDEIEIGEISPDEWPKYKALRLEALQLDPQSFGASYERSLQLDDEKWRERLEIAASDALHWVVFAKEEGHLVGIAAAAVDDKPAIAGVYSVYVTRSHRGKGISKRLMHALYDRIAAHPEIRATRLSVNSTQDPAVGLYRSLGYYVIREEEVKMGDGKTYLDLVMERLFTPEPE